MSIKALFIANAVMVLFISFVMLQSFSGMNATGFMGKMHQHGLVKENTAHS